METAQRSESVDGEALWARVDSFLRSRLNPDLYGRWFSPLRLHARAGDRVEVSAPDRFHRDFIDDNYRTWFEEFLPNLVGERLKVSFVVGATPSRPEQRLAPVTAAEPPRGRSEDARAPEPPRDARPNPRYTFESFVEGDSNRFALAAAKSVVLKPGVNYHPLFLHGDSGLGKTHLLHAIANALLAAHPDARVTIVSTERYTNEFV